MSVDLWVDVPNARFPYAGVCTGGRPRQQHLRQARARGIRKVVNLCSASERNDFDEGALTQSLGMGYQSIPITGPTDLTLENAKLLAGAIGDASSQPILIHCASGNRVGALFALKARYIDGCPIEQSLAIGRSAGLTTLESEVRCILAGL